MQRPRGITGVVVRGTSKTYAHGHDIPLTHANIDAEQARRLLNGFDPAESEEMTRTLIHFPESRHYARTERLMAASARKASA